ncbi:SDR family oxidoreductase [Fluviibacterium sp. DFM31]|uniref:SDR family oxidoreductase n=1 Tax=Meridianimarinicoccus marinus TaxID=3231483 RepID=A0ABV3L6S8_9RHOB
MTNALFDLTGATALVTGSSRGLGRAMAQGLAAAGAAVVVHGREIAGAERAAERLCALGHEASAIAFDVADAEAVQRAADELTARGCNPDILVNNAGINLRAPLLEQSLEDWHRVTATHLDGTFHVARAFVPAMVAAGKGRVINICSLASSVARPKIAAYSAAKGGLAMLTRSMAVEWGPLGICCNGIAPGYFATDLNLPLTEDESFDAWVRGRVPLQRWGQPDEMIGAAVFLAAPASGYVNGHILSVDGGFLASM